MKKVSIFFALMLVVCSAFAQPRISPSQLAKGSATTAQILVSDTTVTGAKAGNLVFRNLSSEVNRIVSPQLGLSWNKEGNIVGSTDFIGSTNEQNVIFKRNGIEKMRLDAVGLFVGEQGVYTSTPHASAIPALTVGGAMSDIQSEVHVLSEAYSGLLADANGSFIKVGVDYTDGSSKINSNVPLYISSAIFTNSGFGKAAKFVNLEEKGGRIAIIDNDNSIAKTSFLADSLYLSGGNSFNSMRYFGTQNNFALPFITNGTERMRITQNGNIGIGTNAPTYTLDLVAGQNTASANGLRVVSSTGNALVVQGGGISNPIATFNNVSGVEQMRVASNGALLVGKTSTIANVSFDALNDIVANGMRIGHGNNNRLTNTAFGELALNAISTGDWNTGLGYQCLTLNNTGIANTAIGYTALQVNTSGGHNTAIGLNSLKLNTTASNNTGIGSFTLSKNTGANNTAIGAFAGQENTTGASNTGIGSNALYGTTTGSGNTAIGSFSGYSISTGGGNTLIGENAGRNITTGSNNLLIGNVNSTDITSGSNNVIIGRASGYGNLSNNIILSDGSGNRRLNIDSAGRVGIGTNTPNVSAVFEVSSATQGVLLPRMTTTQINAITTPSAGLIVYNTTLNALCFYDGTQWNKFSHSAM